MSRKAYFVVSGTIFGLSAVVHLARVVYQVPIHVGDRAIPVWPSWGGLVVTGVLCAWAFRLLRR